MKFTRPFCLAAAAVGMFLLSPVSQMNQAHGDIVEFGDLSDPSATQDHSFGLTAGRDFSGTGVVLTETGVVLTTGEVTDITVTITAGAGVTDIINTSGRLGDDSSMIVPPIDGVDDRFQNNGVINIAVAASNPLVSVDGFTNFGLDRLANNVGAGFRIDGVDYTRGVAVNGDNDPRFGIAIAGGIVPGDNIDVTFLDPRPAATVEGTVLRGFAFQLSPAAASVPEPSSLALLGLVGLGFATRRRK